MKRFAPGEVMPGAAAPPADDPARDAAVVGDDGRDLTDVPKSVTLVRQSHRGS